jgi:hypothetical protein
MRQHTIFGNMQFLVQIDCQGEISCDLWDFPGIFFSDFTMKFPSIFT